MGEKLLRWSVGGVGVASSPKGVAEQAALARIKLTAVPLVVDPSDALALIAILYPLFGAHVDRAQLVGSPLGPVAEQDGDATETTWLTMVSTGVARLDNGAALVLEDTTTTAAGTRYPVPLARLKGLALAAHGVGLAAVDLWCWYCPSYAATTFGSFRFATVVDDAVNPLPSVLPELTRLSSAFQLSTFATIGTVAGVTIYAVECKLALLLSTGVIWLRPGDVGNGAHQIPPAVANNSASHYAFFPGVFLRRTDFLRDLSTISPAEADPVTTLAGALPLFQVDRPPTYSRWVLHLDGQFRVVTVAHPQGSDLRKPLEIWNAVIVPAIRLGSLITYSFSEGGGQRLFFPTGQVILTGANQVDGAEFIEPLDGQTASIWSIVTQV